MINLIKTKNIKKQIAENPENVLDIINNAEIAICITNKDGIFVAVNDLYCKFYNYPKDKLIGNHFSMMLPDGPDKEMLTKLHDKFIMDKYEIIRNWTVRGSDGKPIKIQADAGYSDTIFDKTPHKITFVALI